MHEGNSGSLPSDPRLSVDQLCAFRGQVVERSRDVGDRISNVMKAFAATRQESADRGIGSQRPQQLNMRAPDWDHRLLYTLLLDDFPIHRLDAVAGAVGRDGLIEVIDGHGDVVQIQQQHPISVATAFTPRPVGSIRGRPEGDHMGSVITSIARTPIGRYGGGFQPLQAVDLGAAAMSAALERSGLPPEQVHEVLFGHVLQAGTGQITARQAAVRAGVPMSVPATTINKVCLSGMSAIAMADKDIRLGEASFVLAGGMESMSNAPYVMPAARWGARMGDTTMIDSMMNDGLWCAFDQCSMGESSDIKSGSLGVTREEQDEWSAQSHARAAAATDSGHFAEEIVPVSVPQRKGDPQEIGTDEGIRPDVTPEALGRLRAAFTKDGTITAGNASQISDGAAAVVVADRAAAEAAGLPILAEILGYGQMAGPDATLHERPAEALTIALDKAGLTPADLDLVEFNEAFAAVGIWSMKMLDLPADRVNVHGGAVALGHPLGATGARITVTLINALRARGGGIGGAALCGGGGQGDALVLRVEG